MQTSRSKLPTEVRIDLSRFKPRPYQLPLLDALDNKGYKRALAIWPRRAGKDICAYNWLIEQAIERPAVYYYIFPTYSQGRKILWDSIDNDGFRILSYLPEELLESSNSSEMKMRLKNGSVIQVVGSDRYDTLVGTNPRAVVFSEYALQDPRAYQYIKPILAANDGTAVFLSTPRGKNHLYELYQIAMDNPDMWFLSKLTVNETNHIPMSVIQADIASGEMSEELSAQEYFTSFERGIEGSWYAKYLDKAYLEGRIGEVPYEVGSPVFTAWDLGVSKDANCIIFFQVIGQIVRIIDCYTETRKSSEHYVGVLKEKGYLYSKHIAPHDIRVFEATSGLTRWERYKELGVTFTQAPDLGIIDGIDVVRANFNRLWIDARKCAKLIKSLENYRQEFNVKRNMYEPIPYKDWSNHLCDTLRYAMISIKKLGVGTSAQELEERYNKARYGDQYSMPNFFRDNTQY